MIEKLEKSLKRYEELQALISDPSIIRDQNRYRELRQEHASLADLVEEFLRYQKLEAEIASNTALIEGADGAEGADDAEGADGAEGADDAEIVELAREELASLEQKKAASLDLLKVLLIPKDPLDLKDTIMEIRGGTGGDEAALFAADLLRMYSYFAESQKWKIEVLSSSPTEIGGFKEIILSITGRSVYANLRYESGVHRVQRVPATEAGGRIHTSAASVAVLPEIEETEIAINPSDLRIDVMRSGGPGGQSVNTTDSAVRITHLRTGIIVHCQDEKSQHKNKAKALRILRARLYDAEEERKHAERAQTRKSQIGSGERSEKIRTYNYPQNRVTDHRINLTLYKLDAVMKGDIGEFVAALKMNAQEAYLSSETA